MSNEEAILKNQIMNLDESTTIINMVYDLMVQNSIKGVYSIDHDKLADMVVDIGVSEPSIKIQGSDGSEYILRLTKTYSPAPQRDIPADQLTVPVNTGLINHLCVGMYETELSPDDKISRLSEYLENSTEESDDDFANALIYEQYEFDLVKYKSEIARHFNETIADYGVMEGGGVSIEFKPMEGATIQSPREYNFQTDTLEFNVVFSYGQLLDFAVRNTQGLNDYLQANYKSRSGFISLTPDNFHDWRTSYKDVDIRAVAAVINYWNEHHGCYFEEIQQDFINAVNEKLIIDEFITIKDGE